MKKKELRELVYQQAQTIQKLQKENIYLKQKFIEIKDFIMKSIVGIMGGGAR
ncbi:MAG: hypothetical protein U9O83_01185 [Campylobacterota bacterium]|nr:hypothetical protein [Campylobacterota bacterium]